MVEKLILYNTFHLNIYYDNITCHSNTYEVYIDKKLSISINDAMTYLCKLNNKMLFKLLSMIKRLLI